MSWRDRALVIGLFGPALLFAGGVTIGALRTLDDADAWGAIDRRGAAIVGSSTCARCHPNEHASWHRTFHRTMTQEAEQAAILAPFAGEHLDYLGFRAEMSGGAEGKPRLRITALSGDDRAEAGGVTLLDVEIVMTVGSHRYQQYLARIDREGAGELWRLPVAWVIAEGRWIHLNGAFLEPEGLPGDDEAYLRHLSRWNDNCVFCHNTAPIPGAREDGSFATTVGELGIACEACHGPGGGHTARHRDPLRRILAVTRVDDAGDQSIAGPHRLEPRRASAICGRCHGNRIARDLAAVLRDGDGFLPGEDLDVVSRPIFADSIIAGSGANTADEQPPLFATRFWPDGTPRLSAYEYQGLLLSPCYAEGGPEALGCADCHAMHDSEPAMQLRRDRQGDAVCRRCHDEVTLPLGHGGHAAAVTCADCHMPRITYGLVQGMISHRISAPDPGAWVGRSDQPDACTQCHVDRSREWAALAMPSLGLRGSAPQDPRAEESWASRVFLDLYGGDPLQRVLATDALSRPAVPVDPRVRMTWLVGALEDEYPAVRAAAGRALGELAGATEERMVSELLAGYDFLGVVAERLAVIDALRGRLGGDPLAANPERLEHLRERRDDQLLWIGE